MAQQGERVSRSAAGRKSEQGEGRAGAQQGERASRAKGEQGEKWENRSSKLSSKKKFSRRCRNTELPFKKNVIFAADGARWPTGAQAEERRQLQRTSASRPAQSAAKDISQQASAGDCKSASAQQMGAARAGRKMAEKPLFNPCGIKKMPINKGFSHGAVEWR